MKLIEPQRWVNLIQSMNTWASSSDVVFHVISVLADALVFLFPIYLVIMYIIGIKKKNDTRKQYTLHIFAASCMAAIINIIIQLFVDKARPETVLQSSHNLLLKHLPTMSFPSDHAAVSMAFGIWSYYFIKYLLSPKDQSKLQYWGIFFIIASIIMSLARVAVGVHWPTDILAGWIVWIVAVVIINQIPKGFFSWIIMIEKKILGFLYK